MSDFSDLWASSNPVKTQKTAPTLAAARSNVTNRSRASTPDTFNLFASAHSSQANSRPITPAPIQRTPSKPSSTNGDAFDGLVSLGSKGSSSGNLTIAERAALAERQRQGKTKQDEPPTFDSQTSFWAQFENKTPQKTAESTTNNDGDLFDFLSETPSSSNGPNSNAPAGPTPQRAPEPRTNHDSDVFDFNFLADAPNSSQGSKSNTPVPSWDDDILGDLAKPVTSVKSEPKPSTPSRELNEPPDVKTVRHSPTIPPHIIGRIVEMGFSVDQAKAALAATTTGVDVDAALEILLQDASSFSDFPEADRNNNAVRSKNSVPQRRTNIPGEESSRSGSPSMNQQALQEHADKLIAQASSIGLSMFNRANAIWKEGRDKVVKAYEERAVASGSETDKAKQRPRWMDSRPAEPTAWKDSIEEPLAPSTVPERPRTGAPSSGPSRVTTPPVLSSFLPPEPLEPLLTRPSIPLSDAELSDSNKHKSVGTEHFKLGRFAEAEDAYSRALDALPGSHLLRIPLYNNRAITRLKIGQYAGAIEDTTEVLNLITVDLGQSWHPGKESSVDDRQNLSDAVGKSLRRRAEAFEGLEKWKDASSDWNRLNGATWVHPTLKKDAIAGMSRCRRMIVGPTVVGPTVGSTSRKSQPKPSVAVPAKNSGQAVSRLRAANLAQETEEQARHDLKDIVDSRIQVWRTGKENNIRALIASLETVLSPSFGWQKVNMAELVTPSQVKIRYNKAIAKVHPDKLNVNNTTLEERMIANGVFSTLNEAMHSFK